MLQYTYTRTYLHKNKTIKSKIKSRTYLIKKMYTELGISALQQEQFALQEQAIIDRFFILFIFVHLYYIYTHIQYIKQSWTGEDLCSCHHFH